MQRHSFAAVALLFVLPISVLSSGEDGSFTSLVGKTLTISVGGDEPTIWVFGEEGKVVVSGDVAADGVDAFYKQDGQAVYVRIGDYEHRGIYDGETLTFSEQDHSMFLETDLVPSPAKYDVLLPPSYAEGEKTYPLLFWLHGGGGPDGHLPGAADMFREMWAAGTLSELVVVTPHAGRYPNNYMDFRDGSQSWETFITGELLNNLRSQYRVSKERDGTFVGGVSMGGFGSLMLGLRHLEIFGAIIAYEPMVEPAHAGVWSSNRAALRRTPVKDDESETEADEADWAAYNPATIVRDNADAIRASGIKIYLEVGSEDVYEFYEGTNFLHQTLYKNGIKHEYRYVYGADHVGASFQYRYPDGLAFLNRMINPPPPDPAVERFRRFVLSN